MKLKWKYVGELGVEVEKLHKQGVIKAGSGQGMLGWKMKYLEECGIALRGEDGWMANRDIVKECRYCAGVYIQRTAREKKYCSDLCKNRYNLGK